MDTPPGFEIEGANFVNCPKDFRGEFTVPDGITTIGSGAFYGCRLLTRIHFHHGITAIGNSAFRDCSDLACVDIPAGCAAIGHRAFLGCSSLTDVHIPDGVTSVGRHAFGDCRCLAGVDIPDSVTDIGYRAFYNCEKLAHAVVPKAATVGDDAFPQSCKIFNYTSEYRMHLAKNLADALAHDDVDVVGLHVPQFVTAVGGRGGKGI